MQERDGSDRDYALINSKGFGGNNATAALLSPTTTEGLLRQHHGESARAWRDRCEATWRRSRLELKRLAGEWSPTYRFDEGVVDDKAVSVSDTAIELGDKLITLRSRAPKHGASTDCYSATGRECPGIPVHVCHRDAPNRNSHPRLVAPGPDEAELETILRAAMRAPIMAACALAFRRDRR
ncbi:MAG: hypothetical protein CM15mP74_06900 [Halieaceae bacterium]|nr:MAG: hypothetical protein CM15mP74_06900 [Halieaceae bacterium]